LDKVLAALLTAVASALFALGYIYLNSYYSALGISMLEVEYSIQDILVYSITSLYWGVQSESFAMCALALMTVLLIYWKLEDLVAMSHPISGRQNLAGFKTKALFVCVSSIGIILLTSFVNESVAAGKRKAALDISADRRMWVGLDEQRTGVLKPLSKPGSYLAYLTATRSYVFAAIKYRDGKDYWIVRIDRSKINHFRVFNDG
jgi:hypothetical protein